MTTYDVDLPKAYSVFPRDLTEAEQIVLQVTQNLELNKIKPDYVRTLQELTNFRPERIEATNPQRVRIDIAPSVDKHPERRNNLIETLRSQLGTAITPANV